MAMNSLRGCEYDLRKREGTLLFKHSGNESHHVNLCSARLRNESERTLRALCQPTSEKPHLPARFKNMAIRIHSRCASVSILVDSRKKKTRIHGFRRFPPP